MVDLTADEWRDRYRDGGAAVRDVSSQLRELGFRPPESLARLPEWIESHKGAVTQALEEGEDE